VDKIVRPRPTTATSIPSLLQIFQNEWDALMLETYTLKQQLESVRQELSHALYQHDAAYRVIARLIKERDEARNALANYHPSSTSTSTDKNQSMDIESSSNNISSLSDEIKNKITKKSTELSKERKNRKISANLSPAEEIKNYEVISSFNIHKASKPGVTCVDIHPTKQEFILTGGMDSAVHIFNREVNKVTGNFSEHKKSITDVLFHPTQEIFFTCSTDHTAKIWNISEKKSLHTIHSHKDDVVACTLHATGDYWVTASMDNTWALHDISSLTTLVQISSESGYQCSSFHPDGLLLGTGSVDSQVKIWDIKNLKNVATFEGHKGKVDLSFSENGYYLATAAEDSIKLWDLRKLKNFHTFNLPENVQVTSISWDFSGSYLAVAGTDIRIFVGKTLNHVTNLTAHTDLVTDIKWGNDAKFLVSTSMDRSVKFWSLKS